MHSCAVYSDEMGSVGLGNGRRANVADAGQGTPVPDGGQQAAVRARATLTGQMRRLAGLEGDQECLLAELDRQIEEVKAGFSARLDSLQRSIAAKRGRIEEFCRARRDELLPSGARSVKTLYGRVGFRTVGAQVILAPEVDEGEACERLRGQGLGRFVRVRCSADRAGLRGAVRAGELGEGTLAACGVRLTDPRDSFYCALDSVAAAGAEPR